MAGQLETPEKELRHEVSDVQGVSRGIEPAIEGDGAFA